MVVLILVIIVLSQSACSSDDESESSQRLHGKAVAGFSMGAMGATFLGLAHPERLDAIGALGGPMDFTWLLSYMERSHLGGFCTLEELEALLATNPGNPEILNDPSALGCMKPSPAMATAVLPEHEQSFAAWRYTDNGGSFDRNEYLDLFTDLVLALGNPLYHNPDSRVLPPGVSALDREDICENPVVIPRFYNAEFNPTGTYSAVTFCDGQAKVSFCKDTERVLDPCEDRSSSCADEGGVDEATPKHRADIYRAHAGRYRSCGPHLTRPVPFALALDLNGNGKKDYGEPIVINARERFQDTGVDGCPDELEDGYGGCLETPRTDGLRDPNGDNHHWQRNPTGTEGDFRWQRGEPFLDHGLDGVPGTGDYGEGDGVFTEAPSRKAYLEKDARSVLETSDRTPRKHLAFYADGGIRDVFNFGISAAHVWSAFASVAPERSGVYETLASLPNAPKTEEGFDPLSMKAGDLPERMLYLYGNPAASEKAITSGDGDHVGTHRQLVNRLLLFLRWLSVRWEGLPDPPGDGTPVSSRTHSLTFRSEALGGVEREFGVVLPPGYDAKENAKARYPVLLLLHGYGMKPVGPGGFVETALLWDGAMASGRIRKMIVVFPSGRCCYGDESGRRICTEAEGAASGLPWGCQSGSFFLDRQEGPGYGSSLLELLDVIDGRFRTGR